MLKDVLNEEELLDLALFRLSHEDDNVALDVVVAYVIDNQLEPFDDEVSEEQEALLAMEVEKLIVNYCLTSLTKKGLVDIDFSEEEPRYSISDLGKEVSDACKDLE